MKRADLEELVNFGCDTHSVMGALVTVDASLSCIMITVEYNRRTLFEYYVAPADTEAEKGEEILMPETVAEILNALPGVILKKKAQDELRELYPLTFVKDYFGYYDDTIDERPDFVHYLLEDEWAEGEDVYKRKGILPEYDLNKHKTNGGVYYSSISVKE